MNSLLGLLPTIAHFHQANTPSSVSPTPERRCLIALDVTMNLISEVTTIIDTVTHSVF